MIISTTVDIEPLPKARPRFGKSRTYTDVKIRRYEEEVGWKLKPHVAKRNDLDDLKVDLTIRTKTRQRKDIDNLVKSIFDACNKIVWDDDQQVIELHVVLSRGSDKPGFDIHVEVLENRSRTCAKCGNGLTKSQGRFCSKQCYDSGQRKGIYRVCNSCGDSIYRKADKAKAKNAFCSTACRTKNNKECRQCGSLVINQLNGSRSVFCSHPCSDAWHRSRTLKSKLGGYCGECGKRISRRSSLCRACYHGSRRNKITPSID